MADQGARKAAQHMAYPSTLRSPADANLYQIKAIQRRMVEINIHCMHNYPHPKHSRRKPARRKDFAERLRELILSSYHPHITYYEATHRWRCSHCQLNLLTYPLYEHLRRIPTLSPNAPSPGARTTAGSAPPSFPSRASQGATTAGPTHYNPKRNFHPPQSSTSLLPRPVYLPKVRSHGPYGSAQIEKRVSRSSIYGVL